MRKLNGQFSEECQHYQRGDNHKVNYEADNRQHHERAEFIHKIAEPQNEQYSRPYCQAKLINNKAGEQGGHRSRKRRSRFRQVICLKRLSARGAWRDTVEILSDDRYRERFLKLCPL